MMSETGVRRDLAAYPWMLLRGRDIEMAETESSKPALAVLVIMIGLWVVLLITMRAGIGFSSPMASDSHGSTTDVQEQFRAEQGAQPPGGGDEVSGEEYGVLQQVLVDFPQLTTVFEAAMVDGKMSYSEAENILARKEALEAEAEAGKQKQARERLQTTIEKLRNQ